MVHTLTFALVVPACRICLFYPTQAARKKPIEKLTLADLGISTEAHTTVLHTSEPPARKAGEKLKDVEELVTRLKKHGFI